jgi:galactose-1-phosphate uridylyltransferase
MRRSEVWPLIEFRKNVRDGIETRLDPLLGWQTRINPERARRPKQRGSGDSSDFSVGSSGECPFCPQRLEKKTPVFPSELANGGRIVRGQTKVFPNLNPFGENHAVGVMTDEHFVPPAAFSMSILLDCLEASRDFFLRVHPANPKACYPIFLWNYMPPSAGSIVHPHVQLLLECDPLPLLRMEMEAADSYFRESGRNFWHALMDEERRRGERLVGTAGSACVLASFAPRGFNEVQILMPDALCIAELTSGQMEDLAGCVWRILQGYAGNGLGSFNFLIFSAPLGATFPYFSLHAKMISRPYPAAVYTNDTGPFERLCDVWVIDTVPEVLASELAEFF